MGRAYEVRKASIMKTGAARGKIYTTFAKEIFLVAKGNPDPDLNVPLKRLIEKAKKKEVPNDIIKRALDKAKGNGTESYEVVTYEGFGPGESTLIIKTLTDNVNRTVGEVRAAFNKVHKSLGVTNSVAYNYDYLAVLEFKSSLGEKIFEELLNDNIDIKDFEEENGNIFISLNPKDLNKAKDKLESIVPNIEYTLDEVGLYPKDKVTLSNEDLEIFNKLYNLLDNIDDVSEIYHNVNM